MGSLWAFYACWAALCVGGLALLVAFAALRGIDETFGRDLDFVEE